MDQSSLAALTAGYLEARHDLIERRVPLKGWTVKIAPRVAKEIESQFASGCTFESHGAAHIYGADWFVEADVPPDCLWLDVPGQPRTVVTCGWSASR